MEFIEKLAESLKKKQSEVADFLENAPRKYKVYTIPKRTAGHRIIAQPSKELKSYQRAFTRLLKLPSHDTAMAYTESRGIKDNAIRHKDNSYLLKMDLENFFNSITPQLFWREWQRYFPRLSDDETQLIEKLLFWSPSKRHINRLMLSIGAPSSPMLSNFCMFYFDDAISKWCADNGITYTRYADDMTFSTHQKGGLFDIPETLNEYLNNIFNGQLIINRTKTVYSSKAHNRHVTGITLNNEGQLSLGREKKRYIRHLIYQMTLGNLTCEEASYMKGILAFAKHIEPEFIDRLKQKYSEKVIDEAIN